MIVVNHVYRVLGLVCEHRSIKKAKTKKSKRYGPNKF